MPYYKKRKHYQNQQITSTVVRQPSIFNDRYFCKLKYNYTDTQVQYTFASTSPYIFSGNAPYDPLFSPGFADHQPTGWDQLETLYNKYCCVGSKIRMRWSNMLTIGDNVTANTGPWTVIPDDIMEVVLVPYAHGTLPSTTPESPYVKSIRLNPACLNSKSSGTIKHYMTCQKMFGKTDILGDNVYSALTTQAPGHRWFWHINLTKPLTTAGEVLGWQVEIDITYYVWFFDRKVFNVS